MNGKNHDVSEKTDSEKGEAEVVKLKIDPEFRDKIPALTDAEFEQLKENILADGEVYEPIVTWNDTIVDGHNRWTIICQNWDKLKDKFRTKPMDFSDKWEAFEWMYKKQLGRRNLTEEQKAYMVGKMYEARKRSQGGTGANQHTATKEQSGQNVQSATRREQRNGTAGEIGKEIGVDGRTVRRAEKFARGIDALRENSPEAADAVLKGNSGATKAEISELSNKTAQEIQNVAKDILSGEIKKPHPKPHKQSQEEQDKAALISKIVADMANPESTPKFTIDFLVEDIQANGAIYIDLLRNSLTERSTLLTKENKPRVAAEIQSIIDKIKKIKELVET